MEVKIMNNIEALYIPYDRIMTEFTEDKVKSRYAHLYQELSNFLSIYSLDKKLRIDQIALTHAVLDYFTDISRLKKLHNIKNVNEIKVCAYQCYWLLRRHPLQILDNTDSKEAVVFANEKFVFSKIAQHLLGIHLNDEIAEEHQKSVISFLDTLYYYLKFRECNPQVLEMFIVAFRAGEIVGNNSKDKKIEE